MDSVNQRGLWVTVLSNREDLIQDLSGACHLECLLESVRNEISKT